MVIFETGDSEFGIVDGQQRLTTITIMLCALRDLLFKNGFNQLGEGIHTKIEKYNLENTPKFILISDTSFPYFQGFVQNIKKVQVSEDNIDEEKNIKIAYDYFLEKINEKAFAGGASPEDLFRITRDLILGLKIVQIKLDNEDDAYLIFETLNARGQNLSPSDLIKNSIFRYVQKQHASIDIPQEQWKRMVKNIEGAQSVVSVDDFLYHWWLSMHKQVTAKELHKPYKELITKQNAESILDEVCADSKIYAKLLSASEIEWSREETEVVKSLNAFALFNIKMHLPAILSLGRAYESKRVNLKNFKRCLAYIERFHFIFTAICSKRSSGTISKMYCDFAKIINTCKDTEPSSKAIDAFLKELRGKLPGYESFKPMFMELEYRNGNTRQKKLIDYILICFYKHYSNGSTPDLNTHNIEHLLSQAAAKDDDTLESVGRIGNLFLIPDSINTGLGHKSFAEKKQILAENGCIIPPEILNEADWSKHSIYSRSEEMSRTAYNILWHL